MCALSSDVWPSVRFGNQKARPGGWAKSLENVKSKVWRKCSTKQPLHPISALLKMQYLLMWTLQQLIYAIDKCPLKCTFASIPSKFKLLCCEVIFVLKGSRWVEPEDWGDKLTTCFGSACSLPSWLRGTNTAWTSISKSEPGKNNPSTDPATSRTEFLIIKMCFLYVYKLSCC